MQVNLYEAKTQLSQLVESACGGETIIIAKAGKPMAKLVPLTVDDKPRIRFGGMKGEFTIAADFDASLPDDLLAAFEGRTGD